jgi:amino acid transporter
VGLIAVLHHHPGTFPITKSWFSISGIGGRGSLSLGLLLAVFIFSGWEGTLYVNEETKHRRINPGRAAILAVVLLTIIYSVSQLGLQGVVGPKQLQAHSTSALVYVAEVLGGPSWAKVMALSLALSVIAATLTNIVLTSRIIYGMASYRTLPGFLATVSRRFATPVAASIIVGLLLIALTWVYLLANSVQNAFTAVIDVSGLLFGSFYILTALATVVYYRRRVVTSFWDALILGILPVAAAGFLGLIIYKSLLVAPASQIWSLVGVAVLGVLLMFAARFILKSPFFHIQRESDGQPADRPRAGSHRR